MTRLSGFSLGSLRHDKEANHEQVSLVNLLAGLAVGIE
jgi:hypothetical protein